MVGAAEGKYLYPHCLCQKLVVHMQNRFSVFSENHKPPPQTTSKINDKKAVSFIDERITQILESFVNNCVSLIM